MTPETWLSDPELLRLGLYAALGTLLFSMLIVPAIVLALPAAYFNEHHRHRLRAERRYSLLWLVVIVVKNSLGLILVPLGLLMLVLPGQGLLTIVVGLVLLDFPGKFRLERWIVSRPRILALLNRFRVALNKAPFEL
ncbi:MAG: PGPGW domain-containing protein [Gammaproteobacteria bacterium]